MLAVKSQFQSFELTLEEQTQSLRLSSLNVAALHNLRTDTLHAMLALEFNPTEPLEYMRQKVYKQGQVDMLSYLIDASEAVTNPVTTTEE